MFGSSKKQQLLQTRKIESELDDLLVAIREGEEAWIITPYATMNKLSSLKRKIAEAARRGGNISFVIKQVISHLIRCWNA